MSEPDGDDVPDEVWEHRELDQKLAALAHPVRRFLLELLIWGDETAGSLAASAADAFGISTTRASQHLQVLARARLVDVNADGPTRNYRPNDGELSDVAAWLESLRPGHGGDH